MRVLPAKIKKMKHQPVQGRMGRGGGRRDVLKQQKPKVRENICADSAKRKERKGEREGEGDPIDGVKVWRGQ